MKKHLRFYCILLTCMLCSISAKAEFDYRVRYQIGNFYYYLDFSSMEAIIADNNSYSGSLVIPEKLYSGYGTFTITGIYAFAFDDCDGLTSVTIPNSVTSIGYMAFHGCNKLESFYFKGGLPTTLSEALIPTTCIIYVPTEYLQDYKDALGADYKYIYTWNPNGSGDGDKPVTKCATPTVSYESGELKFACETAGAKYHYTISDKDMATDAYSENGKVALSAAYEISVYATADGHSASEKAQATLYWLNANLKDATNINMVKTRGVVASAHDGIVNVSGLANGEEVKFYAADGKFIGQAVAANGTASYAVSEALVIAKVGNNSIKIAIK